MQHPIVLLQEVFLGDKDLLTESVILRTLYLSRYMTCMINNIFRRQASCMYETCHVIVYFTSKTVYSILLIRTLLEVLLGVLLMERFAFVPRTTSREDSSL